MLPLSIGEECLSAESPPIAVGVGAGRTDRDEGKVLSQLGNSALNLV